MIWIAESKLKTSLIRSQPHFHTAHNTGLGHFYDFRIVHDFRPSSRSRETLAQNQEIHLYFAIFCFGIFLPLFELKLEQMPSRHESWAVAQFAHFNEKAKAFIYS